MKYMLNQNCQTRKNRIPIEKLRHKLSDPEFLLQKNRTVSKVKYRLQLIDLKLSRRYNRKIIQKIEHRLKKPDSIARKLTKKGCQITFENAREKLNDIVGIRVVCLYSDDVYKIASMVKRQKDFRLIKEKDYIKNPKKSGYQSLHLILDIPLSFQEDTILQRIELQIRTIAMDFWAGVDNHICYKRNPEESKKTERDLKNYSAIISDMDRQMLELRKKVEKI